MSQSPRAQILSQFMMITETWTRDSFSLPISGIYNQPASCNAARNFTFADDKHAKPLKFSSAPEGCTYQSSAPEGCTYQSSAPEGCTYQSSAPEGRTYQSSAPEGRNISLVLPKDAHISLVLPKDAHISLVLLKDAHIRKAHYPIAWTRGPVVGKPLPDTRSSVDSPKERKLSPTRPTAKSENLSVNSVLPSREKSRVIS
ncbi:NBS-LRR type resistance protein [Cucumis melo var. makuwa]|uniref:NBS-LRR type resistance protein n=1 Tax=Cucumis melo var. makuwa TaxID=1194695 RepID=A0A5A7UDZ8_CUCMM|nr:NBS-LRR type resistance protein [Cucumis melo var. makuwa]